MEIFNRNNKLIRFFVAFFVALTGSIVFGYLHTPIPWLLGPMFAVLIGSRFGKIDYFWPRQIRDIGLIFVGYSIGLSFTKNALLQILRNLPSMFLMTVLLVLFCAGIAFFVSKLTNVDYPTALTGSIPGGLSQMIIFAEEVKGIDITTVTFLQVSRLMMIVFFIPFLAFSPFFANEKVNNIISNRAQVSVSSAGPFFPNILLFAIVCVIFAIVGKKLKFPTPYLLGPILGTAIFSIEGFHGPSLPAPILDVSQFMIGGYIGLLLKPEKLQHKAKIISLALISGMVMIVGSLLLSLLLVYQNHISPATSLLSTAPGGMDQMGILAHEIHANLSMVTGYQLFRLFFIYFAIPPLLRWFFKIAARKAAKA
ncbi:AbrB family transcriptional regulator [Bacillota bacterium Lsc_1132]